MRAGRLAGALCLAALGALAGCGGSSGDATATRQPGETVRREPIRVDVSAARVGAALRLDVEAIGRGVREEAAFEDPDRWQIDARQRGRTLPRLVNGSVSVDRRPAGRVQWDTVVKFSVVYQVEHGGGAVRVRLRPPGGPAVVRVFEP